MNRLQAGAFLAILASGACDFLEPARVDIEDVLVLPSGPLASRLEISLQQA